MALVNPNIAMSYRPTVEYQPRNALAEYAQIQQIMGGQRQAEMADMQMEALRRKDRAISQIQAAAAKNGGPTDRREIARAYVQSGVPEFMQFGLKLEQDLDDLDAFERIMGGGARPATGGGAATAPTSAAGALTGAAPAAAEPVKSTDFDMRSHVEEKGTPESPFIEVMPYESSPTSTQRRAQGKSQAELRGMLQSDSESGRPLVRYVNPMDSASGRVFSYSMPTTTNPFLVEPLPPFEPTNALAPSEPAPANAMLAAQPATPPENVNQLAAAGGAAAAAPSADPVAALRAKRDQFIARGTPRALQAAKSLDADIALMSKRITASPGSVVYDASGKVIATAPEAQPSELRTMQQLGYPLTQEGYASFRAAQMREQAPPALVPILQNGRPVLVPREQAVGQTPFSPASVQVLGMGPQRETAAPSQRAPAGYRFTPSGDLEPIPGGPAARAAEGSAAAQPKPLTPVQEAARRDKLGKEFKSATAALQTTQDVLDSISFVRAEPGLSRATGFTGTFLPSIPEGAAASAETRLKNLEGKVTALGKAQAAATGAIGSIANQEWQILRDQIAAIDRTKGTGPLLKQLELVELQAQGAMARIRDAYQRQFGEDFARFPQFSDLPAPQSSFKPATPANRRATPGAAPASSGVDTNNPLLR